MDLYTQYLRLNVVFGNFFIFIICCFDCIIISFILAKLNIFVCLFINVSHLKYIYLGKLFGHKLTFYENKHQKSIKFTVFDTRFVLANIIDTPYSFVSCFTVMINIRKRKRQQLPVSKRI